MTKSPETKENFNFHVLIPASGTGARMGSNIPKQYTRLNSKPVLRHTIETFLNIKACKSIQIIINPNHQTLYNEAIQGLNLPPEIHGGKTRKESVFNGLKALSHLKKADKILIHDAARPLITEQDILKVVNALSHNQAASLATPIQDSVRNNQDIVDRSNLWTLQTPQGFHYATILNAHTQHGDQDATDDTALVSAAGIHVELIEGSKTNIKVTTPEDMTIAQKLMSTPQTRTGIGFDVHAFDFESDTKTRPLILCSVKIDHTHGLKGHSDADVGLHALTDAILGAIGEGDIGTHFPPSDPQFKNMDSAIFLQKTAELLEEKNATISNLDLTLICEEPKITPHRIQMQNRIAEILKIDPTQISVKATTSEGLGFTGRGEGIAAQAIATIIMK